MRREVLGAALALVWFTGVAHAGQAEDAALLAARTIEERCAEAWSSKPVQQSEALIEVSRTLGEVSRAYEATSAVYLLYWRGAVFQCLGQYEAALDDLEAFVREVGEDPTYSAQASEARLRLRRAGRRLDEAGKGFAAAWLQERDPAELRIGYGAGVARQARVCTDDVPGALYASRCTPGVSPTEAEVTAAVPVDVRVQGAGWFRPSIGLGGGVELRFLPRVAQEATGGKDLSVHLAATRPSVLAAIGPVFRRVRTTGRAVGFVARPQLAVGVDGFEVQAGHYNYVADPTGRQLQGGEWVVVRLGLRVEATAQVEIANRALLEIGGRLAAFVPSPGALMAAGVPAEDAVQIPLEPESSDRLVGGAEVRLLAVPGDAARVAIGPFVRGDVDARWMRVPETAAAVWDDAWKVVSTRRVQVALIGGITMELGGPPAVR